MQEGCKFALVVVMLYIRH